MIEYRPLVISFPFFLGEGKGLRFLFNCSAETAIINKPITTKIEAKRRIGLVVFIIRISGIKAYNAKSTICTPT